VAADGTLYVTLTPEGSAVPAVWRFRANTWAAITPPISNFTFSNRWWAGIAVDSKNSDRIALADTNQSARDLFISNDAGATWYIITGDPTTPAVYEPGTHRTASYMKPGWWQGNSFQYNWSGGLVFDPANSNRVWATTGYAAFVYADITTNPVVVDSFNHMKGLEMLIGLRVAPLPAATGSGVFVGAMDKVGFIVRDPAVVPAKNVSNVPIANLTGIGVSAGTNTMLVSYSQSDYSYGETLRSTDGGQTWTQVGKPFPSYPSGYGGTQGGDVAVSAADGNRLVWIPIDTGWYPNTHPPVYSTNGGATWQTCAGLPTYFAALENIWNGYANVLTADAVTTLNFYVYWYDSTTGTGTFYRSLDGGVTWAATVSDLVGKTGSQLTARPGVAGEIWLKLGANLYRSTNAGQSLTAITGWTMVDAFGFGAPLSGQTGSTAYAVGVRAGVRGLFQSSDGGTTWTRSLDNGAMPFTLISTVCGDLAVPGRVYASTFGRGFYFVDLVLGSGAPPTITQGAAAIPAVVTTGATSAL